MFRLAIPLRAMLAALAAVGTVGGITGDVLAGVGEEVGVTEVDLGGCPPVDFLSELIHAPFRIVYRHDFLRVRVVRIWFTTSFHRWSPETMKWRMRSVAVP